MPCSSSKDPMKTPAFLLPLFALQFICHGQAQDSIRADVEPASRPACMDSLYLDLRARPFNALTRENLAFLSRMDSSCAQAVTAAAPVSPVQEAKSQSLTSPNPVPPIAPEDEGGKPVNPGWKPGMAAPPSSSASTSGLLLAASAGVGILGVLLVANASHTEQKTREVSAGPCFQVWGDLCEDRPETYTESYTEKKTDGGAVVLGSLLMVTSLGLMIGGVSAAVAYQPVGPPQRLAFAPEDWRMGIRYTWALE